MAGLPHHLPGVHRCAPFETAKPETGRIAQLSILGRFLFHLSLIHSYPN